MENIFFDNLCFFFLFDIRLKVLSICFVLWPGFDPEDIGYSFEKNPHSFLSTLSVDGEADSKQIVMQHQKFSDSGVNKLPSSDKQWIRNQARYCKVPAEIV